MASPLWSPAGETAAQLWYERSILAGLFLGAIGFGVHATLFFQASRSLYIHRNKGHNRLFLAYVIVVFLLSNIGNATNIRFGEMVFIDYRDYPGGPGAYFVEQSTALAAVLCNNVYICLSWFQDGLLLYRFWIIFGKRRIYLGLPVLMFTASITLSCLLIAMLSRPTLTLWSTISFQLALAYWSISISFNVLVTILICWRLLAMRRKLAKSMAQKESISPYTTVSAMLIESASLYSITGLGFLISYGVNSPVQNLWLPLLGQVQSIAPLLIILRVAEGKAWSAETGNSFVSTTINFASDNVISSKSFTPRSRTVNDTSSTRSMGSDILAGEMSGIPMKKL
ncbi:hypothetical protein DFH05DRAFT_1401645 [Lentinula detonsa]|uniref:Uncharacterized protein n=1 Tax=Lentinula detonsa TaxID=2804962 RepID=A0A9W8TW50_9AGAR|nr:hypothetical protein DFH05DRAFT_1401645 [Lentinula detonsa]